MTRLFVLALAALPVVGAAAQEAPGTTPPARTEPSSIHVHNYGASDPACLRWTDGCRSCSRGANGESLCSNIGIACQPTEVKCARRQEPLPKQ